MPQPAKDALRECVDQFVEEVSAIVGQSALEAVQEALDGTTAAGPRSTGRRTAPRRKVSARAWKKAGRRIRRSGADIESLASSVVAEVKREPGRRLGEIAAALGEEAKTIRRPVTTLMESGALSSEGVRGGTRYFPGGARKRSKTGKKKARRKKTTRRKKTGAA
jgi:hypothetical protein